MREEEKERRRINQQYTQDKRNGMLGYCIQDNVYIDSRTKIFAKRLREVLGYHTLSTGDPFKDWMHSDLCWIDKSLLQRYMSGERKPNYKNLWRLLNYIQTFMPNFNLLYFFDEKEEMTLPNK